VKNSLLSNNSSLNSNNHSIRIGNKNKTEAFSKLTLMRLINSGNNSIRKMNTISYYDLFNLDKLNNNNIINKSFIDFAWLEKLKIYLEAYRLENEITAAEEEKDKDLNKSKEKANENNQKTFLDLNKKIDFFLKKLKNTTTFDFIFELETIESFVESFYCEVSALLKDEKIGFKDINKLVHSNKKFKKKLFNFFQSDEMINGGNPKAKRNSKENAEKPFKAFDAIYMVFDILHELYLNSEIFEKIISFKIRKRSENSILLDKFISEIEKKTNKNTNNDDIILVNKEFDSADNKDISNISSKSAKSLPQIYDKINGIYEDNLNIDPTIYRDKNVILSVIYIKLTYSYLLSFQK